MWLWWNLEHLLWNEREEDHSTEREEDHSTEREEVHSTEREEVHSTEREEDHSTERMNSRLLPDALLAITCINSYFGNEIHFVWEWQRNAPRHCFTWSWGVLRGVCLDHRAASENHIIESNHTITLYILLNIMHTTVVEKYVYNDNVS